MTPRAGVASLVVDVRPIDHPTARDRGIGRYTAGLLGGLSRIGAPVIGLYGSEVEADRARVLAPDLALRPWDPASIAEHARPGTWYLATGLLLHPVPADPIPSVVTAARLPVAAVMYDVIPYRHPDTYLRDPNARALARVRAPLARTVDAMLAISDFSADTAAEELGYPRQRIRTIGAGVGESFAPPASRPMPWPERFVPGGADVVAVTGADERKNTDGLLRAWGMVGADIRRTARLVVATGAPPAVLDRWRAVAEEAGVAGEVVFTGWVTDDEMVALLQRARLAVVPSREEGFGLPVLEAAACGCPVICSGTSSLPEILDEPAAWFDPDDPRSIAAAIERGLSDDGCRDLLHTAGERAVARFTWERTATETLAALADLGPRWPIRVRRPPSRIAVAGRFPGASGGGLGALAGALRRAPGAPRVDVLVDRSGVPDPTAAGPERHPVRAMGRYVKRWDFDHVVVAVDGVGTGAADLAASNPCHVILSGDLADHGEAAMARARSVIVASDEMAVLAHDAHPSGPPILVLPIPAPESPGEAASDLSDAGVAGFDATAATLLAWLADVDHLPPGTIRPRPDR